MIIKLFIINNFKSNSYLKLVFIINSIIILYKNIKIDFNIFLKKINNFITSKKKNQVKDSYRGEGEKGKMKNSDLRNSPASWVI